MQQAIAVLLWVVAGLCAILTIYPYMLYPLVLRFLPARVVHTGRIRSDGGREFALLFSAYNEAKSLPHKIRNLRQLRAAYPSLEILAYDDCSSDGTADILENAALDIRVFRGTERQGKAHGMKLLAAATEREYLVFTDANVELAPQAIDQLCASYTDPTVGGICGLLEYTDSEGTPTASAGGLYWRLEETLKSLESRSGNVMGADGSIFSIRRELYPDFPDTVLDDLTVSMSVIFRGRRLVKDSRVVAFERLVASKTDDVRRRVRIATRSFHTHLWLRPQLNAMSAGDRWRYLSHRYLRWHGAFFLVPGYVCAVTALALRHWPAAIVAVAATVLVAVIASRVTLGPLSSATHMSWSIVLTGLGVVRARQGRTMSTWRPPTR